MSAEVERAGVRDDRALVAAAGMGGMQNLPDSLLGPVRDDWEAAALWLSALSARRPAISRATLDNYAREIQRLRWYCELIRPGHTTPGRWTIPDVTGYLDFLRDRSGDFICPRRTARPIDADWTPFRTRLGPAALANAQKVLHALFEFWFKVGHRRANPMATIGSGSRLVQDENRRQAVPPTLIDQVLDLMENRPKRGTFDKLLHVRNRFVLRLLQYSGLRANEAVLANMGDIERFDDPSKGKQYWSIFVRHGKGGKTGRVPLPDLVIDELRAYRYAYGLNREPLPGEATALILSPRTRRHAGMERGYAKAGTRRVLRLWGEVRRRASLWDLVKGEFDACAAQLLEIGLDAEAALLTQASTHWLRHTFGRTLALQNVDLRLIAKAMRHGDIRTTDKNYLHTDFLEVARALEGKNQ
ncbi:tyrosine-type recombinase/integrase [Achromobacter aloeverae]